MSKTPFARLLLRITRWFDYRNFEDARNNRIASYLQITAFLTLIACAAIAINFMIAGDMLVVWFLAVGVILFGWVLYLIRIKLLQPAAILFLVSMPILLTLGLLGKNGIHGAGALIFPVTIIFASLILNRKPFIIFVIGILVCVALLLVAEANGLLYQSRLDEPGIPLFITYAIVLIFTALVVRVLTEDLQNNLERSIGKEKILEEQTRLLEASESRWRTLVTNSPVIIAQCDSEGRIFFINYPNIDPAILATGMTIYSFVPEQYHATIRTRLEEIFRTGKPLQNEIEGLSPNGDLTWYAITAGPVIENGEVSSAVIIATNITRLKKAEAEIRALNTELDQRVRERTEELESAYDELELFSYTVSHNLRTPARAMTGFSEMLIRESKDQLSEEGQQRLQRISNNAVTMGLMIDDLLEFLQLGKVPIKKRQVSPTAIARHALGKLPAFIGTQHINLTIGDMPLCLADEILLTQVYVHLLDNAIKFSRNNPTAEIQVGSFDRDGEIIYFVRDNGIGFDMQYVGKLFGMFAQLHRPGEFEGNGIGLATVQRIIRRHNGKVWAEGEPGKGATFYFTLPG